MPVITISRQTGSFGDEIAQSLSEKLGFELMTRERILTDFFHNAATKNDLYMLKVSAKYYNNKSITGITFLEHLKQSLVKYSSEKSVIMVGFGSSLIFSGMRDAIHIRLIADKDIRVDRIRKRFRVTLPEALEIVELSDRKHKKFVSTVFGVNLADDNLYDIIINTSRMDPIEGAAAIYSLFNERLRMLSLERSAEPNGTLITQEKPAPLKNASEAEFAKILDMYQIEWKYEPRTFPIEWDAEGNISLAFTPDFYLTNFNTYIELTTMNQKYITKKNKKMKKLKELYPGINIKIVNKKDFNNLIQRFKISKGEE